MPGLNLLTLASETAWIVGRTFFTHFFDKKRIIEESEARKDITYDQAFNIVKNFLRSSSDGTVEDLQRFCSHFVPSPAWVTVITVKIPAQVAADAAKILIEHIGEETMDNLIVGHLQLVGVAKALMPNLILGRQDLVAEESDSWWSYRG